jgi:hypothetical protein
MGFFSYNIDSPILFEECLSKEQNKTFRNTIDNHHSYVKYKDVPQRRINWNIYDTKSGDVIGAIGISSCVLAINSRDSWIGWKKEERLRASNSIGNNYRFCLIPNSGIKNLGTLSLKMFRTLSMKRWKEKYGDDLVLIETYVQPSISGSDNKRNGAVYLADNWIQVGETLGNSIKKAPVLLWQKENSKRGELARTNPEEAIKKYAVGREHYVITESEKKLVFVKPLVKNFREVLLGNYQEKISYNKQI